MLTRSRVEVRLSRLFNVLPYAFSTAQLVLIEGAGFKQGRKSLWTLLLRMERAGKIVRIYRPMRRAGGTDLICWISRKWLTSEGAPTQEYQMSESARKHLPSRRRCITQKVRINNQTVHYTVGLYPNGEPGELFIDVSKAGAALRNWAGEAGMMFSIALQHGTPLKTVLELFVGTRCEPCGAVEGHPRIATCTSIMDLIARDLAITFLGREDLADTVEWTSVPVPISDRAELPPPLEGQSCVCRKHQRN